MRATARSRAIGEFQGSGDVYNGYSGVEGQKSPSGTHFCARTLRASNHRRGKKVISRAETYRAQKVAQKYSWFILGFVLLWQKVISLSLEQVNVSL